MHFSKTNCQISSMVRQLEPKDLKINSCFGQKYPICNKIALKIIFVGFQAMSESKFSMILKRPVLNVSD